MFAELFGNLHTLLKKQHSLDLSCRVNKKLLKKLYVVVNYDFVGMFCPHLVQIFTQLQVRKVPSRYIPKRYTRDARTNTSFDRHYRRFVGGDGETKANRMIELLPDWCALQQASIMSSEVMGKYLLNC
jgi:hypothetical protein